MQFRLFNRLIFGAPPVNKRAGDGARRMPQQVVPIARHPHARRQEQVARGDRHLAAKGRVQFGPRVAGRHEAQPVKLNSREGGRTWGHLRGRRHQLRVRLTGVGHRRHKPWQRAGDAPLRERAIVSGILHGRDPIGDVFIARHILVAIGILV